jgi:hypothetical protein
MIFVKLFFIIFPILIALLMVRILWPNKIPSTSLFLIQVHISIALGFGISSFICFISAIFFGVTSYAIIITELLLFTVIFLIYFFKNKTSHYPIEKEENIKLFNKYPLSRLFFACFCIATITSAVIFVLISLIHPHGWYSDVWSMWNWKARAIFRSGIQNTYAFSEIQYWESGDYPLLLPCIVASVWSLLGHETTIVPILVALFFTFVIIGLLFSSLAYLSNTNQGLLASLILLGIGSFVRDGTDLCADMPIGLYFLATITLYCLYHFEDERRLHYVFMAGIMASFAAWTKNEGLLFFACLIFARFIVVFPKQGFQTFLKEMSIFLAGAMPILLIILFFRMYFDLSNDVISAQGFKEITSRLTDISRYIIVGQSFIKEFFDRLGYRPILFLFLIVFWGFSSERKNQMGIYTTILVLLFQSIGYFMVYIITPHDILWHLKTSLGRISLPLLPTVMLVSFLILANTDEVIEQKSPFYRLFIRQSKKWVQKLFVFK